MIKLLMLNVLPGHVAEHYLQYGQDNTQVGVATCWVGGATQPSLQELYSHGHEDVCVMFASIPNFWDFYVEDDITKGGRECLRLLNEIIADFDEVRAHHLLS